METLEIFENNMGLTRTQLPNAISVQASVELSFVNDTLSFLNEELSFKNDKGPVPEAKRHVEQPRKEEPQEENNSNKRWLTAEEASAVVNWLNQVIRNDIQPEITRYAHKVLYNLNSARLDYDSLYVELEKIKQAYNYAKRRK